jgi:hypothetical protein
MKIVPMLVATTLAIVVVSLLPSVASARVPNGSNAKHSAAGPAADDPLKASVARWDANHDGVYTCAEWQAYVVHLFALADTGGKGFLVATDLSIIGKQEPLFRDANMAFFDANGDGKISRLEFAAVPSPFFARYDPNHTCEVTAASLNQGASKPARGGKSGNRSQTMPTQ